jgi:hypothetical protein
MKGKNERKKRKERKKREEERIKDTIQTQHQIGVVGPHIQVPPIHLLQRRGCVDVGPHHLLAEDEGEGGKDEEKEGGG